MDTEDQEALRVRTLADFDRASEDVAGAIRLLAAIRGGQSGDLARTIAVAITQIETGKLWLAEAQRKYQWGV